jgi:hydrogenase nickel incorporation protein HypA/HybF
MPLSRLLTVHEMSLSQGVVDAIEAAARREGFARVRTVWLEIGRLAPVEQEAMRFCFDVVTRGSCAEGARLEIVATPGRAWCLQCSDTVAIDDPVAACPLCGSYQIQVTGGRDMRVKELEVE